MDSDGQEHQELRPSLPPEAPWPSHWILLQGRLIRKALRGHTCFHLCKPVGPRETLSIQLINPSLHLHLATWAEPG